MERANNKEISKRKIKKILEKGNYIDFRIVIDTSKNDNQNDYPIKPLASVQCITYLEGTNCSPMQLYSLVCVLDREKEKILKEHPELNLIKNHTTFLTNDEEKKAYSDSLENFIKKILDL